MANKECQDKLNEYSKENVELQTEVDQQKSQIFMQ